jgi:hypothetical protein
MVQCQKGEWQAVQGSCVPKAGPPPGELDKQLHADGFLLFNLVLCQLPRLVLIC